MASPFDVEPPRWLQAAARPIDTAATGQVLGTALGAGIMSATQDKPFGQAYGEARMNQQDPMWMLKQQALETQVSNTRANMTLTMQKAKWMQEEHDQFANEAPAISRWMQDPDNQPMPEVKSASGVKFFSNAVKVVSTGQGVKDWAKSIDELRKVDPIAASKYNPSQIPSDEMRIQFGNDFQRAKDNASPKPVSPLGKLQTDRADAVKRGDAEAVKQYDAAIQQLTSNKGRSIYMGQDDQGRPIFKMTEGGADVIEPTVAMQSRAQENIVQFKNAIQNIDMVKLTPAMVGVRGMVGEWVVDRGLAQITGLVENERVDGRTLMRMLRAGIMRQVNDSPRFSQQDREEVNKLLPSDGAFETAERGNRALAQVKEIFKKRAKNYAQSIKQKPPVWALDNTELRQEYPTADDIKKLRDEKVISESEALDALVRGGYTFTQPTTP